MTTGHIHGSQQCPLLVFQNPGSGHRDCQEVRTTVEQLVGSAGREVSFFQQTQGRPLHQSLSAAFEQAAQCNGTVVVSGGDGTINAAASIAVERAEPLGIIPAGTFNFVARSHGIPEDTTEAVELLLREQPRATRVGKINDKLFLVNASIGSYARLQHEREGFKRRIGRSRTVASIAAIASALQNSPSMQLGLNYQGEEQSMTCSTLIVCNSRLQLELVGVDTLPDRTADELACVTLKPVGVVTQLGMIWKGWQRQISEADDLEAFLFDNLNIRNMNRRSRSILVAVDGEMHRLRLPLSVGVSEQPLWLIRSAIEGEETKA